MQKYAASNVKINSKRKEINSKKKIVDEGFKNYQFIDKLNNILFHLLYLLLCLVKHLYKKIDLQLDSKKLIIMILCLDYNKDVTVELLLKHMLINHNVFNIQINAYEVDATEANTEQIEAVIELLQQFKIHIVASFEEKIIFEIVRNLNKLVSSNYNENVSTYLTKQMNYSYGYLASIFQKVLHFTINEYFSFARIIKAINLLNNQNKTLTEIAYELNYSSVAHLSKQFKKVIGLTFTDYSTILAKRTQTSESC